MKSIVVTAKRWFQRTYGNTYFTASIIVNGETVANLPFQYGYGDHYMDVAADTLERLGMMPGRSHSQNGSADPLWHWCRKNGIALSYSAADVSRKKDL